MEKKFNHLVRLIGKKTSAAEMPISFALRLTDNTPHVFGKGTPAFTIVVNDAKGLAALCSLDATNVAESYMAGGLDIQGDMLQVFALREMFSDRHPLHFVWRFVRPIIFGQVSTDKKSISHHYDYDGDFYRLFLDRRHRCYSQGVFLNDDEPLENAMTRKLDFAIESTGLRPGDRVLDIGAGWGAFVEHAGRKGIKVTGLTISKQSEKFVTDLISKRTCRARFCASTFSSTKPTDRMTP